MAANEGEFGGEGPVALDGVEVGVADTGVFDINEDLVRTGLLDGDLLVVESCNSVSK